MYENVSELIVIYSYTYDTVNKLKFIMFVRYDVKSGFLLNNCHFNKINCECDFGAVERDLMEITVVPL